MFAPTPNTTSTSKTGIGMDPFTLAALGISAGTSIAQYVQGRGIAKDAEKRSEELRNQGIPKMETPEAYFDLFELAKENQAENLAIENAKSNFATTVDTLSQGGGSRGLIGGLNTSARQNTADIYGLEAQKGKNIQNALKTLADAEARTEQFNVGNEANLFFNDLAQADASFNAGKQMQAGAISNFGATAAQGFLAEAQMKNALEIAKLKKENGGKIAKEGMKTPGEFDHDTNPIDLVQDGKKVGEATGGEYIFNPEQSDKIRELAEKEKSPLSRYVIGLLNRFDKEARRR